MTTSPALGPDPAARGRVRTTRGWVPRPGDPAGPAGCLERGEPSWSTATWAAAACRSARVVLGTMNFGPETERAGQLAILDARPRRRHQPRRHRERVRLGQGRGRHRADHRPLVRPGRRPPGARRCSPPSCTARWATWPNQTLPLGAEHPPGLRRVAAAAADRPHRPLPDAPRRPGHPVGGDLGGDERAAPAGQDHLRRLVELRRLAPGQGAGERAPGGGHLGLVSEQSLYNLLVRDVELEVLPAAQDYGLGVIPWSPLQGGLLGGVVRKPSARAAAGSAGRAKEALEEHRPAIEAYEDLCAEIGEEPGDVALAWLMAQPGVTAPIVGPADHGAARRRALRATRAAPSTTPPWPGWTRSSPRAGPPRRPTPGSCGTVPGRTGRAAPRARPAGRARARRGRKVSLRRRRAGPCGHVGGQRHQPEPRAGPQPRHQPDPPGAGERPARPGPPPPP